jgi:hypothetical protein
MSSSSSASEPKAQLENTHPSQSTTFVPPEPAFNPTQPDGLNSHIIDLNDDRAPEIHQHESEQFRNYAWPIYTDLSIAANSASDIDLRSAFRTFITNTANYAYLDTHMWRELCERRESVSYDLYFYVQVLSNNTPGILNMFLNNVPDATQLATTGLLARDATKVNFQATRNRSTAAVTNTAAAITSGSQNWPPPPEGWGFELTSAYRNRLTEPVPFVYTCQNNSLVFEHHSSTKTALFQCNKTRAADGEYPAALNIETYPDSSLTNLQLASAPWYMMMPDLTLRLRNVSATAISLTIDAYARPSGPLPRAGLFPIDTDVNNSFLFRLPTTTWTRFGTPLKSNLPLSAATAGMAALGVGEAVTSYAISKTNATLARVGIPFAPPTQTAHEWGLHTTPCDLPDELDEFFFNTIRFVDQTKGTLSTTAKASVVFKVAYGDVSGHDLQLNTGITHSNVTAVQWHLLRLNQFSSLSFDYYKRYHIMLPPTSDPLSFNLLIARIPYTKINRITRAVDTNSIDVAPTLTNQPSTGLAVATDLYAPTYPTTAAALMYSDFHLRITGVDLQKARLETGAYVVDIPCHWPFASGSVQEFPMVASNNFVPTTSEEHLFLIEPGASRTATGLSAGIIIQPETILTNIRRANPALRSTFPAFSYTGVCDPCSPFKNVGPYAMIAPTSTTRAIPGPMTLRTQFDWIGSDRTTKSVNGMPLSSAFAMPGRGHLPSNLPNPTQAIPKPPFMGIEQSPRDYLSSEFTAGSFSGTVTGAKNNFCVGGLPRASSTVLNTVETPSTFQTPSFCGPSLPQFILQHFWCGSGPTVNRVVFNTAPTSVVGYLGTAITAPANFSSYLVNNGYMINPITVTNSTNITPALNMVGMPHQLDSAGHFVWECQAYGNCSYYPISTSVVSPRDGTVGSVVGTDPCMPDMDRFYDRFLSITCDIAGDTIFTVNQYTLQHTQSFRGKVHLFTGFDATTIP